MKSFLSPEELWKEFDISGPLDEDVLQTDEFGEYVYEQVMFSGERYLGGVCRIFGVLAYAKNQTAPMPCIMLVHDVGGRVDFSYIDYFLHLGFAVFMCDYSGERAGERHSIFPHSKEEMNFQKNNRPDITRGLEDSVWIADTLIFRHALKFLRSQSIIDVNKIGVVSLGLGSIIGFHLAFCEPELALCINFHYGGWRDFESISKNLDSDMASYLLAVAPQVYSPLAKVPLFLLGSTNTKTGDSDRIFDTFARCNGTIPNFLYLSPNYIATVDHLATRNLRLLLNQFLLGADVHLPMMPQLTFTIEDGELLVACDFESEFDANKVKLFYSQGDNPPHNRAYKSVHLVQNTDGHYVGNVPISSSLSTVMLASVQFKNGYTLSSNQVKVPAFGTLLKKQNVITLGKRESFFPLGTLTYPNANQFFAEKSETVESAGAFDLIGVSAPRIASFALSDPTLEKVDKTILLQIYSELPQQIRLIISVGENAEESFSTTIDLVGGELWQKIMLDPTDFSDAELKPLDSFENCTLLFFNSEYDFKISNMTMV